ncbi:MAG: SDR family oxidoreductase [Flavobacteriaceae bacterium]|nr:SDR family oxidoreductase [Flavobacteriaceae bacterium]
MQNHKILLAGATGYLGKHLLEALLANQIPTIALARNPDALESYAHALLQTTRVELTQAGSLEGILKGVSTVISTVGITRQKDGLTYMDVDYQANKNLLDAAKKAGVKKFIYVSAIAGDANRHLKIFEAKEKFVDCLKASGLQYTVVRPNGFFSDMKDFLNMAKGGTIYLFGKGKQQLNPIHGADLANAIVAQLPNAINEYTIGGPDVLRLQQIGNLAMRAWGKQPKIVYLPDWIRRFLLKSIRIFTSVKTYGPIEFFLTLMAEDHIAPSYGTHHLKDFFRQEVKQIRQHKHQGSRTK